MAPPSAEKGTVSYNIRHNHRTRNCWGALVDRGANGGIGGRDMKEISRYQHRTVDLTGLKEHTVRSLGVGTAGAWTRTQAGPVIIICNQYALMPDDKTIHSCAQWEAYGIKVHDKAPSANGGKTPYIETPHGFRIPMCIRNGLPFIQMRPFTTHEFKTLPHIHMTSDVLWNPSVMDYTVSEAWYSGQPAPSGPPMDSPFDVMGEYTEDRGNDADDDEPTTTIPVQRSTLRAYLVDIIHDEIDDYFEYFQVGSSWYKHYDKELTARAHATKRRTSSRR